MANIVLGDPPALIDGAVYGEYLPWLLRHFFYRTCAYCLANHLVVTVDHFEPQRYADSRVHDPTNLVPACSACNGRGGKSDYHPLHRERPRLPRDAAGHAVIDVRSESFADFFIVDPTGELRTHDPATEARGAWNATTLLKLDRPTLNNYRKGLIEKCRACEKLLSSTRVPEPERTDVTNVLLKGHR